MSYRKIPRIDGYTRNQILGFVKMKLRTDWNWTLRAWEILLSYQNPTEISNLCANERNFVGFDKFDTAFLTNLWKKRKHLTPKEREYVQHKIEKYASQLIPKMDLKKLKKQLDEYYNPRNNTVQRRKQQVFEQLLSQSNFNR